MKEGVREADRGRVQSGGEHGVRECWRVGRRQEDNGRTGRGEKEVGMQTGRGEHDVREWGMEEGRAGKWRNEGGEARRGEHDVREWGVEEGRAGKWRNEGGEAGRGEHGVKEEGRAGRGMQVEGEHGVREGVKVGREGDE